MNGKADVDLTNVNATGTAAMAKMSMPSSKYDTLTLGANGATYTAPANGYYFWLITSGGLSYYGIANNSGSAMETGSVAAAANYGVRLFMPVKKGDIITVIYQWTPASYTFRFIYAEGDK